MVCTKENAAAQAFAEHIVGFDLPEDILGKFGRLLGFKEVQKESFSRTALDVQSQSRNLPTAKNHQWLRWWIQAKNFPKILSNEWVADPSTSVPPPWSTTIRELGRGGGFG